MCKTEIYSWSPFHQQFSIGIHIWWKFGFIVTPLHGTMYHIAINFCTWHDSTVLPYAKFHNYHLTKIWMREESNFHRIWITNTWLLAGIFMYGTDRNIRDIMRSHISRWIVETVKEAYTQADRQYDRVTAHEVRALSASWAYNCQVALPDILAAAFWRSSGVFQNSYLRDMACVAEGMSTLGPVVVAQHVVDPGHLHPPP